MQNPISPPLRKSNRPCQPWGASKFKSITHAEGVALLGDFVYLFGVFKLRECAALNQTTFLSLADLHADDVRAGVVWAANAITDTTLDPLRPSAQLAVLRELFDALGLASSRVTLRVEPRVPKRSKRKPH